jgi:RNA polymerase sigma factor (sigma-70 family)
LADFLTWRRYHYAMNDTDMELLSRYIQHGAEDAFAEIVRRHLNVVHSAALRQVHSPQLAEEVAQSTFIKLAREARKLRQETILVAWLYQVTRREAIDVVRREARRQLREQIATEVNSVNAATTTSDWAHIEPILDEGMGALSEDDRAAILLRYFECKSLRAVGEILGASEDAARKRVNRAVERLREYFAERGVSIGVTGLVALLSTHAAVAAPVGLAVAITTSATVATAAMPSTILGLTKTVTMTTIHKALVGTMIVAAVGTGIYETGRAAQFQSRAQTLEQQQQSFTLENRQLRQQRDELASKLAAAQQKDQSQRQNGESGELLRLRAEVTRLRQSARDLAELKAAASATGHDPEIEATLKTWARRAAQLKERLGQMPNKGIPELQLLTEKNWFDAVKNSKQLETDVEVRQALNNLRNSAKDAFGEMTREALKSYAAANNGLLPDDLPQLKPYYEAPVDDAILQRYSLLQKGKLADAPQTEFLFAEKGPAVDDEYDSLYEFRMNGTRANSVSDPGDIVWQGLVQYAKAHNGVLSSDPAALLPYLKRPLDQGKVQDILSSIPPGITTLDQLKAASPK